MTSLTPCVLDELLSWTLLIKNNVDKWQYDIEIENCCISTTKSSQIQFGTRKRAIRCKHIVDAETAFTKNPLINKEHQRISFHSIHWKFTNCFLKTKSGENRKWWGVHWSYSYYPQAFIVKKCGYFITSWSDQFPFDKMMKKKRTRRVYTLNGVHNCATTSTQIYHLPKVDKL
jgi:hypothetical protein